MDELSKKLEKVLNLSSFESATFTFNSAKVVAKKGMTAEDIIAVYYINQNIRNIQINQARQKHIEMIKEYKTEKAMEN